MPTIAGIFQLNNEASLGNHGFELMKAINIRSSEEAIIWNQGQIFLGSVVPKLGETLPYVDAEKKMAITADVHLNNREELLNHLGIIEEVEREAVQDGRLILMAYQKWGRDCPTFLVGKFVFAIWDDSEEMLFGAIGYDTEGPLYYFHNQETFAFCTSIAPLLTLPYIDNKFNAHWFETFASDYEPRINEADHFITPYEQIMQIPPGYVITFTKDQLEISLYRKQKANGSRRKKSSSYDEYV